MNSGVFFRRVNTQQSAISGCDWYYVGKTGIDLELSKTPVINFLFQSCDDLRNRRLEFLAGSYGLRLVITTEKMGNNRAGLK
jgi:hypothetical protein